jgi:hypothetical protein
MTTDKSKTVRRGMTSTHNTFDAAVAALQKLVSEAVQKGWKKSERVGGFKRRPDAFTSMPTAPKSGAK